MPGHGDPAGPTRQATQGGCLKVILNISKRFPLTPSIVAEIHEFCLARATADTRSLDAVLKESQRTGRHSAYSAEVLVRHWAEDIVLPRIVPHDFSAADLNAMAAHLRKFWDGCHKRGVVLPSVQWRDVLPKGRTVTTAGIFEK